jgi:hypothetical protein
LHLPDEPNNQDHFDYKQKQALFLGIIEKSSKSRNHGLLFLPNWCMLHAFWLIAGLHPPKMRKASIIATMTPLQFVRDLRRLQIAAYCTAQSRIKCVALNMDRN